MASPVITAWVKTLGRAGVTLVTSCSCAYCNAVDDVITTRPRPLNWSLRSATGSPRVRRSVAAPL